MKAPKEICQHYLLPDERRVAMRGCIGSGAQQLLGGDMKNYGEIFAKILTKALEREEDEFRELTARFNSPRQTVRSVFHYYESWLSVALAKEALRDSNVPQLRWETNKVDLKFIDIDADESQRTLATFEIKFLDVPLEGTQLSGAVKDFEKQSLQALHDQNVEHYVVLVLAGNRQLVEGWDSAVLQSVVARQFPGARLSLVPPPGYIRLNKPTEQYLGVFVVRVANERVSE